MTNKIYLPGLNGLRAIAASAVIISHIGLHLDMFGLVKTGGYDLGSFGVTIFFTLSGFLITYLLLCEKQLKSCIDIKKFYIRRILRIWPLYFTYLFIVLLYIHFKINSDVWYYIFVVPNVPFAMNAAVGGVLYIPFIGHYWSLGVEEQFYAFWPWFIKKAKNLKWFLILFILIFFLLKITLSITHTLRTFQVFLHYTRFGCLAIGGFGAYLFYEKKDVFKFLNLPIFELSAWFVIILIALKKFHLFSILDHEIVSVVTFVIIYNQINNPKKIISLENKIFDYLGKISFGMYIYNPLVIAIVARFLKKISYNNGTAYIILVYCIVFASVILISHISYNGFEIKFLKFKEKFMTVPSAASKSENFS
ncbi:acyltransferase family protein [Flavobacterium sp. XS2P12]|uniref:acyltransferase family protein n=1 Tax=Flavobacterium melibiosi TaxID=3398734 RepID=UPI003A89778C